MRISRKCFLRLGAVAGYGLLSRKLSGCASLRPGADAAQRLAAVFSNGASAAVVGRRYLQTVQGRECKSAAEIAEGIAGDIDVGVDDLQHLTVEDLKAVLSERIRSDFALERISIVEGWVLSRTEARLCALAAML